MLAIYKRELKSYFYSMIGCVFIAVLLGFAGIYFLAYNLNGGYPYFSYTLSGTLIVLLIAIPVLTMRSFAEERRSKTDQLLLTAPVSLTKVVLGKYFAMVTVLAIPNLIFCLYPLIIKMQGTAYLMVDYMSIFTFFLLGCVFIAIGMFISAMTESQIIASISTFGVLLVLYLWSGILTLFPSTAIGSLIGLIIVLTIVVFYIFHMTDNWLISAVIEVAGIAACVVTYFVKSSLFENLLTKWFSKLAVTDVFSGIASNSIVDVSGIIFYLSLIVLFVFLTVQMIQKRRWS
ncbi:ABC transporter permease subunit [Hespellia stercorisuis]|uniref:ABC-2 type transport system permease protein n=1 Tax=Hespellia stercorisuis DSM 15480 TaxID=1121950 RepID=A0A1M6UXF3_9FIRM|nr:ABC transporter permease subunit [Hespellia stercorisuis]SHK73922.1 ABC-2 type transport system permease protein [Hespellia stercorisuis DSM 15480]